MLEVWKSGCFPEGEKLLEYKGEGGWNELFVMTQAELRARPDNIYLNIRLVALYHSHNKLRDAVLLIQEAEKKTALEMSLEWCSCTVKTLESRTWNLIHRIGELSRALIYWLILALLKWNLFLEMFINGERHLKVLIISFTL